CRRLCPALTCTSLWTLPLYTLNSSLTGPFGNETFLNATKIPFSSSCLSISRILLPMIHFTVCIIGLGGNTLVIHIILRYSKTESVTNIYILNLAIADEPLMLGLPFLAVQNALSSWPFGSLMCRLVMTVDGINQFTSIFCLTVMSIESFLAVVHPIWSSKWRKPQSCQGCEWHSLGDVLHGGPTWVFCNIDWWPPANIWRAAFIIYTSTLGFFEPLLVVCLCYLLIVFKIRTLPGEPEGLYFFVVVLSYVNSCSNPSVYGFLSDNVKRGFSVCLKRVSNRLRKALQRTPRKRRTSVGGESPTGNGPMIGRCPAGIEEPLH
uniref:Somatostatin receptor 3 n=1 Tax=Erpetoichthys calabaricus TaxID=27687 RepID=A0A8C4SZH4_ERPCA